MARGASPCSAVPESVLPRALGVSLAVSLAVSSRA